MDPFLSFCDKSGHQHFMRDATKTGECKKASYWLKKWNNRVCYMIGFKLFLAKDWKSSPYDMVDLLDNIESLSTDIELGIEISLKKRQSSRYKKYSLKFEANFHCSWSEALQRLIELNNLGLPAEVVHINVPYKYICLNLMLDWLLLKDVVRLDSAVCNNYNRSLLMALYKEFRQQLSTRFFGFWLIVTPRVIGWLLTRGLFASCIQFSDNFLAQAVLNKQIYNFTAIRELLYHDDSEVFYGLLRNCTNLKRLQIYSVLDKCRFINTLIVHNRSIQQINWHTFDFDDSLLSLLALHHRTLSVISRTNCSFKVFKASVWYQQVPESFLMRFHSQLQIEELCARVASLRSLVCTQVTESSVCLLLEKQHQLEQVDLTLEYNCFEIPQSLSRCSSITCLNLARRNVHAQMDWSCMGQSSMRLKSLVVFMQSECFFRYASGVLSSAESLVISNGVVTDEEMLLIFQANQSRLTNLSISHCSKLTGTTVQNLGLYCTSLQRLSLEYSFSDVSFEKSDFSAFAACGNPSLKCLMIRAKIMSADALSHLLMRFPSLLYLYLHCSPICITLGDVKEILNVLGQKLLVLGMEYCSSEFRSKVEAHAQTIERCCDIV